MRLRSLLAAAALLSTSLLARADSTTVFDLNSTFVYSGQPGSGSISGTLTLDDTLGYFTGADLTASGFPVSAANTTLTSISNSGDVFGSIGLKAAGGGYTLYLYLMTGTLAGYTGSGICSQTSSPACYFNDLSGYVPPVPPGGEVFEASSGSLEPETIAPTPEPASVLLLATGLLAITVLPGRLGWRAFRSGSQ